MRNSLTKKGLTIKKGPNKRRRVLKFTVAERRAARRKIEPTQEERAKMNLLAKALKKNPIVQAIIAGHPLPDSFFHQ